MRAVDARIVGGSYPELVARWTLDLFCFGPWRRMQIWKMPSAGGASVQVTRHGGYGGFESADGRYFYHAKGDAVPGIWRIPANGGEETEIVASLEAGYWGYWALAESGIFYLDAAETPGMNFFDFTT